MPARWLVFTLLLLAQDLWAECGCLWQGSFADVQQDSDLVVSGEIITSSGNSVDLRVTRKLRGELFQDTVRIWLDTGSLCRADVGNFPLESTWVMALDRIDEVPPGGFNPNTPNISYGRVGDYSLSRCGGYWLRQSENMVTGNLTGGPRWEMAPKMSPILLELVAGYVSGAIDRKTLEEAGRVDPALQELIINTRLFLRQGQ
ncbi:MAG: delta-aminolevulinic acid dehydratase [Halieaceae bacterium]|nr:delta-aminolevulinic acid dehydratase [Halieaceae bacterium]